MQIRDRVIRFKIVCAVEISTRSDSNGRTLIQAAVKFCKYFRSISEFNSAPTVRIRISRRKRNSRQKKSPAGESRTKKKLESNASER